MYFTFDGTIYEQVKGTPMGSPISGLIAEAVLKRVESLVLRHHRPKFWARYVDDTFVVIERDQVLAFKEHLNAVFPDIQFTMEEEENNQLAFLDVRVCRKDRGGLKTKDINDLIMTLLLPLLGSKFVTVASTYASPPPMATSQDLSILLTTVQKADSLVALGVFSICIGTDDCT
ncbi:hypothetical protein SprV_0100453600 [Sparganum proliferum]